MNQGQKNKQASDQCRVVVHLAKALIEVFSEHARMLGERSVDDITPTTTEIIGRRSAAIMETLGDILNGMDAVSEDDGWVDPIFEKAQELWPNPK